MIKRGIPMKPPAAWQRSPRLKPQVVTLPTPTLELPPQEVKIPPPDKIPPGMAKGGSVGSASKRADGCAQRGKTKGKMY